MPLGLLLVLSCYLLLREIRTTYIFFGFEHGWLINALPFGYFNHEFPGQYWLNGYPSQLRYSGFIASPYMPRFLLLLSLSLYLWFFFNLKASSILKEILHHHRTWDNFRFNDVIVLFFNPKLTYHSCLRGAMVGHFVYNCVGGVRGMHVAEKVEENKWIEGH